MRCRRRRADTPIGIIVFARTHTHMANLFAVAVAHTHTRAATHEFTHAQRTQTAHGAWTQRPQHHETRTHRCRVVVIELISNEIEHALTHRSNMIIMIVFVHANVCVCVSVFGTRLVADRIDRPIAESTPPTRPHLPPTLDRTYD